MDYHCPYSDRAVRWLDGLGPARVRVRHRFFGLEQVNRDPTASEWRLWEQPLDYQHYRERQDRRPLAAFLATAVIEASEPEDVQRRFRRAVYAVRFEQAGDISDVDVLEGVAEAAGAQPGRIRDGLDDPEQDVAGRRRIADDWAHARAEYETFGVPTLRFGDERPFYLRLARPIADGGEAAFLDALLAFRSAAPDVLEVKLPDPVEDD
jgi:hypothetical protein